jgi:hypothetical protein
MTAAEDKARSLAQHKRFFGLMTALYVHWPDSEKFKPDSMEHLRAYVLCKAGHRSIKSFYTDPNDGVSAAGLVKILPIIAQMMLDVFCWVWEVGDDEIRVCVPLSIKFELLPHKKACEVFDAVDEYIRSVGFDPDQLLKENEQAA